MYNSCYHNFRIEMGKKRARQQSMQDLISSSISSRGTDCGRANSFGQASISTLSPSATTQLITVLSQLHATAPHNSAIASASTYTIDIITVSIDIPSIQAQSEPTSSSMQAQSDSTPSTVEALHDSSISVLLARVVVL